MSEPSPACGFRRLDAYCFRYARGKVHEVVEWTEPAQQLGVVVSHVTFTIALESAAAWVENPSFAKSFPKAKLELETLRTNPRQQTTTLVKTNNGWRPATSKR